MKPSFFWLTLVILVLITAWFSLMPESVSAHPGRTNSYGCHTCYTNCPSWGLSYREYHCHGNSSYNLPSYTSTSSTGISLPSSNYSSTASQKYYYYNGCLIEGKFNSDALGNFSGIFSSVLGRQPSCKELNFHNNHVTPHERLRSWLYTVKADRALAIDYRYRDILYREATEEEIQFHITHRTPLSRLENYLFNCKERKKAIEKVYEDYGRHLDSKAVSFHFEHRTSISKLVSWASNYQDELEFGKLVDFIGKY